MAALLDIATQSAPPADAVFEQIAAALEAHGLVVLPEGLPEAVAAELWQRLARLGDGDFHRAAIGRGAEQAYNGAVRRDSIHWLDAAEAPAWFDWTGRLMAYLNRRLLLGLFTFESHIARYEAGDFYRKHMDAFRGESNRVLSLVTYLNTDWLPEYGGELVICPDDNDAEAIRVLPAWGTLVLFLSEDFPHEVLPAVRERYSVAGWFHVNHSRSNRVDPPR